MEVGCGGSGLRTSQGDVVNLYFWHLETEDGVCVRHEDFLGRADSPQVKRELGRRMALYDRRAEQALEQRLAKREGHLARSAPTADAPLVLVEERRYTNTRRPTPLLLVGARGI